MTRPLLRRTALLALAATALSGCTLDITEWQVPGGSAEGDTYTVSAVFADVQNLIPQAQVRRQNVAVGDVTDIRLRPDDTVLVTLTLTEGVQVPANAIAELNTTSLLGEMYVDLRVPEGQSPQGELEPGATIPEGRTDLVPQFETALSALSTVLNGSGLAQIQTIVREVNTALAGRVPQTRELIEQLTRVVGTIDANKSAITDLLDRLDTLTATVAADRQTLDLALTELSPGVQAVDASVDDLTEIFTAISALGVTAERVVGDIADETVADLVALQPVVETLAGVRGDLALAVARLGELEPLIERAIPGDYLNLSGQATFALADLLELFRQNSVAGARGAAPGVAP